MSGQENAQERFAPHLKWLDSVSVRFRPKTGAVVESAVSLAAEVQKSTREEIELISRGLSLSARKKLLGLSTLLAEKAMNSRDVEIAHAALVLHILEGFRWDYRENIRRLVFIVYASRQIGADFADIVRSIQDLAAGEARSQLEAFLSRPEALNDLSGFGKKVEGLDGERRFVPK